MFGLGVSSKWTCLYSGAGLAVLYFGDLIYNLVRILRARRNLPKEQRKKLPVNVLAYLPVLFVIGVLSCLVPVSNNNKRLKRAIELIKQGDKAKRSWQEDRFLGKGNLMPHWSEYLNNLFFANGEYHNPANVEDYINEETVIESPGKA